MFVRMHFLYMLPVNLPFSTYTLFKHYKKKKKRLKKKDKKTYNNVTSHFLYVLLSFRMYKISKGTEYEGT